MSRPPADLDGIKQRADAAPKENLRLTRYDHGGGRLVEYIPRPERSFGADDRNLVADFYDEANRECYFHAREDIPALLDLVSSLLAQLTEAQQEIERLKE